METWHRHPNEEVLEAYSLHRLGEQELAPVEEHLLVCETCQAKLQEIDDFIKAVKGAGPELAATPPGGGRLRLPEWLRRWPNLTPGRIALAGAMAVLCAVAMVDLPHTPRTSPAPVSLKALRGGETAAVAPARRRLALALDVPDLAGCAPCRIEIVSDSGQPVWSGEPSFSGGRLMITTPVEFGAGTYWVRLYNGGPGPVREFGLRLK